MEGGSGGRGERVGRKRLKGREGGRKGKGGREEEGKRERRGGKIRVGRKGKGGKEREGKGREGGGRKRRGEKEEVSYLVWDIYNSGVVHSNIKNKIQCLILLWPEVRHMVIKGLTLNTSCKAKLVGG